MNSETIPLLAHASSAAVVAYRSGRAVTAQQFLADAVRLAERLPASRHVLNMCADRYRFTVGLAACLMTERVSLLPSTHTPEVMERLIEFAPDVFCLTDDPACNIALPRVPFPAPEHGDPALPAPADHAALDMDGRTHTLIGTVPAQHMYGFESTVLLALLSGNAFNAERPFYPADIAAAVAAVPRPRVLVTTPVHLRALQSAGTQLPPVDLIISATAPLPLELALEAEAAFHTRLLEIYGSTETGQIATRRTAESAVWRLWPGVRLAARGDRVVAEGGHVEQTTPMCDVIEITGEEEFLLHGRTADLVNVAGKRSSFSYLNAQLNAIPGVVDGAFFLRDTDTGGTGVARLAAVVVAPALSVAELTEQLRRRIDPVFLPRPLVLVDRLPRNATGKLPLLVLQSLAERHLRASGAQ